MEGMKVGGQRLLVVPPELAYGPRGKPPLVPPNSTVEFAVSLLSVRRSGTNPNSVINMVCSAGRWRLRFGVLYCVSGAVQGGDGEEDVCATCERVPQEGVWGVGVGRLVRLGLSFSRTTTTHLACGVWLAWTVPLVRPVRDGLFSCAGCASVLSAAHGREARLFCFESAPCLHWNACCLEFSSFFLLFIACGLLWHVLLSLESRLGKPQLYRHLLEHTSTGDTCVYASSSTQAAGRMPWVQTQQGRHMQKSSTGPEIGGASRSQSRQLWTGNKGAKGEIKQLGGRGAAQNKEEMEQCSAEKPANRRYGRGLHAPCALRGSHQ